MERAKQPIESLERSDLRGLSFRTKEIGCLPKSIDTPDWTLIFQAFPHLPNFPYISRICNRPPDTLPVRGTFGRDSRRTRRVKTVPSVTHAQGASSARWDRA